MARNKRIPLADDLQQKLHTENQQGKLHFKIFKSLPRKSKARITTVYSIAAVDLARYTAKKEPNKISHGSSLIIFSIKL